MCPSKHYRSFFCPQPRTRNLLLEAYADGRREHSVMTPIAKALQPQDRDALAAYFARLQAPATPPQLGAGDTKRAVVAFK